MELAASVVAFLVTASLMLALRPLAFLLGLVDKPGGRKTHSSEVPIIGGISMFAGLIIASVAGGDLGPYGLAITLAAAFLVVVGVLDDRFDLSPVMRLLAHAAAAATLVFGTGFAVNDLGDPLGFGHLSLGWLAVPFTMVACIALINAFNMLDGMDGLAGGVALVAFCGITWLALENAAPTSTIISLSLLGSVLGFLIFNLPARFNRRIRAFMGDAGSTLLGFILACLSLLMIQPARGDVSPLLILWLMPMPIFELFASTARRLSTAVSPMRADRKHFHHRLIDAGFSVRMIFVIYFAASLISAGTALYAARAGAPDSLLFFGFIGMFLVWLVFVRYAGSISALLPVRFRRELENLTN